jgi:DNA-directed RNA polymerase specialized sigma24 family protein
VAGARRRRNDAPVLGRSGRQCREHLKNREAFVLIVLEGVEAEQAAAALGVPLGTLWTRLHHARRELRARLESTDEA